MPYLHLENFNSYANITKEAGYDTGNPCEFTGQTTSSTADYVLYTTALPNVFSDNAVRTAYVRTRRTNDQSGTNTSILQISDDTTWLSLFVVWDTGNLVAYTRTSREGGVTSKGQVTGVTLTVNTWIWLKIEINASDVVTWSYNNSGSTLKPTTWTAVAFDTVSMGAITEIGVSSRTASTSQTYEYDDLQITGGDEEKVVNQSTLETNSIDIRSVYVQRHINALGAHAEIVVNDPSLSNVSTIKGMMREAVQVVIAESSLKLFLGEIMDYNPLTRTINAKGIIDKLKRKHCNTDPRVFVGVVEGVSNKTLYKRSTGKQAIDTFGNYNIAQNYLISFFKQDTRKWIGHPDTISYIDTTTKASDSVIDASTYDVERLFYVINSDLLGNNSKPTSSDYEDWGWSWVGNQVEGVAEWDCYIKGTFTKAILRLQIRIDQLNANDLPIIEVYNYDSTSWVEIYDFDGNFAKFKGDGGQLGLNSTTQDLYKPAVLEFVLDDAALAGDLVDYFDDQGDDSNGVTHYKFKCGISNGLDVGSEGILVEFAELEVICDDTQECTFGQQKITTVNDHDLVMVDAGSVDFTDVNLQADRVCKGDMMIVTKSISDIWDDIVTNASLGTNYNTSFNITDDMVFLQDLTNEPISTFLERISNLFNVIYYATENTVTDPENDKGTITITQSYSSSGVTLTSADILNYGNDPKAISYTIDGSQQRGLVKARGANNIFASQAVTVDDTPALGVEQIIYEVSTLKTRAQLNTFLTNKASFHASSHIEIQFDIDLKVPNQDYSSLDVGKTVALQLPTAADTSICDYSSGGDDGEELLIIGWEYNKNPANGHKDIMTLKLQLRFS